MSFIGNDIMFFENNVDTFSRKGAINHILSECEFLYDSVEHFPILAWTIKESIYKIICKEGHRRAFAPKTISISILNQKSFDFYTGEAIFENNAFYFQTKVGKEYIYSVASRYENILEEMKHYFFNYDSRIFNNEYHDFLDRNKWEIIHTKEGIPYVSGKQNKLDISITHDNNILVISEYHSHQD